MHVQVVLDFVFDADGGRLPAPCRGLNLHGGCDTKKLAGAAKTSFLTKCERDAGTACEATATERKLYGATRTCFIRRCVKDAVGEAG